MAFQTAKEAADRLGVTVRAIQKWAKEGRLDGAKKVGRDWMIPKEAIDALLPEEEKPQPPKAEQMPAGKYYESTALLLMNGEYPGRFSDYIETLPDQTERELARAEYDYYTGNPQSAANLAEKHLNAEAYYQRYTASFIYLFANLTLERNHLASLTLENIAKKSQAKAKEHPDRRIRFTAAYTLSALSVLFHTGTDKTTHVKEFLRPLSGGNKVFACYLWCQKAYLEKRYDRAYAVADTVLAIVPKVYPLAHIYVELIAAVVQLNLQNRELAKEHLLRAYALAKEENFVQPFAEHRRMLQGLMEVELRKEDPAFLAQVLSLSAPFEKSWSLLHNGLTNRTITDQLTITEFNIAMLYHRGWRMKAIADHLELSERTVKNYLHNVYGKLQINSRRDLEDYLLC